MNIINVITSSFPGKIGFPWRSSAKIQPTDHISTAGPYFVAPRSNSGGLQILNRNGSHSSRAFSSLFSIIRSMEITLS